MKFMNMFNRLCIAHPPKNFFFSSIIGKDLNIGCGPASAANNGDRAETGGWRVVSGQCEVVNGELSGVNGQCEWAIIHLVHIHRGPYQSVSFTNLAYLS